MRNLSIRTKLILLVSSATAGFLFLAASEVSKSLKHMGSAEEMSAIGKLAELSVSINNFVHEAQKERGRTAAFVASKEAKGKDELMNQRRQTDEKAEQLRKKIASAPAATREGHLGKAFSTAVSDYFDKLSNHRSSVDAMSLPAGVPIGWYTSMIAAFFDFSAKLVEMSDSAEMTQLLVAFGSLGQAKERMGLERAMLNNAFTRGAFENGKAYQKTVTTIGEQSAYLAAFKSQAPLEVATLYDQTVRGPMVDEAIKMRETALADAAATSLGVDASKWFEASTAKIDLMKKVEDDLAQRAIGLALRNQEAAAADCYRTLAMLVAVIVLTTILAITIIRSITRPVRETVDRLNTIAGGDLSLWDDEVRKDEIGQMRAALSSAVHAMRDTIASVQSTASHVATASEQLLAASESIASGAQSQAAGQEQTAASLTMLAGQVKTNADATREVSSIATDARRDASAGQAVVGQAVGAMKEISESSKRISVITSAIDEIAFQTNLLALNAAVEAARAGESGRGFAVVADEVRNLAQRSAASAKEIRALIDDSRSKVDSGAQLIERSGTTLGEVVKSVDRVASLIVEVSSSSSAQATGIEESKSAVQQMSEVTQVNAAQTEELTATAKTLTQQAQDLGVAAGRFRLE